MSEKSNNEIQIVEDEGIIAESLKHMMKDNGYDVVGTAATEQDAVQQALHETPDLILMDLRLAGDGSGIEAAKTIQDEIQTTVLFLTAYQNDELFEQVDQLDHAGFVTKPITEPELLSAVQTAFE